MVAEINSKLEAIVQNKMGWPALEVGISFSFSRPFAN